MYSIFIEFQEKMCWDPALPIARFRLAWESNEQPVEGFDEGHSSKEQEAHMG